MAEIKMSEIMERVNAMALDDDAPLVTQIEALIAMQKYVAEITETKLRLMASYITAEGEEEDHDYVERLIQEREDEG